MTTSPDRSSRVIALLALAVTCSAISNVLMYVSMRDRVESERALRGETTALLERCLATAANR